MRSWTAPAPPRLPGCGPPLRLYDTATRELRPVAPGATVRMYVCGITPYDAAHLGHASTYVAFDTANRVWRDGGHRVRYIQNVTDIDDPLFERAHATGEHWESIAEREVDAFRSDMSALRVLPPEDLVGAVESVEVIAGLVGRLADAGAAYELDGDVYFPVASAPRFGEVAHLGPERMLALSRERGGDPDRPGKKDPLDSLLWRAQRPGEPAWPSRFGPGRPGWHVECAAIALDRLGPGIDVQAGGSDLTFPHHEMSAAQACAASGSWPFARLFVHSGMVALAGTKMSKSLGNLVFVSGLRAAGADPAAVRLALLAHHYREDWEWTEGQLADATARLSRWRAAAALPAGPPAGELLAQVRRLLADDLRTPDALAAVDRWAGSGEHDRGGRDPRAPEQVADLVDALLGVPLR